MSLPRRPLRFNAVRPIVLDTSLLLPGLLSRGGRPHGRALLILFGSAH